MILLSISSPILLLRCYHQAVLTVFFLTQERFLPDSRAFSGLIPSLSLLMNPIEKDMRTFCALILSKGSIFSSQLLTRAVAFAYANL